MFSIIRAFTGSKFVSQEVLPNLPQSVPIKFAPEFNENGDLIISISSPKYEGLVSEARTMEEACRNAHDAILTYFEVPRECARAIQFDVISSEQDSPTTLLQRIDIKQMANA